MACGPLDGFDFDQRLRHCGRCESPVNSGHLLARGDWREMARYNVYRQWVIVPEIWKFWARAMSRCIERMERTG